MLAKEQRIAIFMPGAMTEPSGKMGFGVLRYSANPIACAIDPAHAGQDAETVTGIPRSAPVVSTIADAVALGAEVLLLGIAPPGGLIPKEWLPQLDAAWAAGLSIVNGLHDLLGPRYVSPVREGQWVWDIRLEPVGLVPATGAARHLSARRVLFVGTDMAVGKMTAGLELWAEARKQGVRAEFVATGQIGMTVTGSGVPLDAVRVDFAGGAIEREMLRYKDAELIIVEGQGSLIHPGSTANLPLLRGAMPTHLIMCARAGQTHLTRVPEVAIPNLRTFANLYEDLAEACGSFPRPVTAAVALNCGHLDGASADDAAMKLEQELGIPVSDPIRHGTARLLEALMAC